MPDRARDSSFDEFWGEEIKSLLATDINSLSRICINPVGGRPPSFSTSFIRTSFSFKNLRCSGVRTQMLRLLRGEEHWYRMHISTMRSTNT
ncbi:hypothetical protein OGATHE_000162 [Ogataea polymorpha]|uniref:Uncharacterized protein n=1 Tax=Ogataea polymorpha TaxID=460523 RepID=A0A9P8PVY6_9ASCO|nr:hypothetical protein OGATHE_000162 [Ogataea polymorpha]